MDAMTPPAEVEPAGHEPPASEPPTSHDDGWRAGTGDGTDPDRHVHLVVLGLPGVGTSTVGRMLAHELHRPYVDHDSIIALCREREALGTEPAGGDPDLDALRRVLSAHGSVVYAAGGEIFERVLAEDLADAYVVWLDATPEVVVERLAGREHPVLGPEPLPVLRRLEGTLGPRIDDLADLRVSVDAEEPEVATEQIRRAWRRRVEELTSEARHGPAT